MLFDGLMRQSEINYLLDELLTNLEEASLDEAEEVVLRLTEEGERENTDPAVLLIA